MPTSNTPANSLSTFRQNRVLSAAGETKTIAARLSLLVQGSSAPVLQRTTESTASSMVLPIPTLEIPSCGISTDMLVDDLPAIKENVRKGFLETQTKVNRWITDFRKKLDGDDNDDPYDGPTRQDSPPRRQNYGPSQSEQLYGIRRSADVSRKSTDKDRYDLDNRMLDDDFTSLELRDDEGVS
jgi:hypothetical protein